MSAATFSCESIEYCIPLQTIKKNKEHEKKKIPLISEDKIVA